MLAITVSSFTGFCSRGSEALLRTRIESIRKYFPKVKFYVLTVYPEDTKFINGVEYIETFGGRREKFHSLSYLILSLWKAILWTTNSLFYRYFGVCFEENVKKIASSSLFISSDGDVLGEDYGFLPFLWRSYFLFFGIVLKKPIFIYAEGAGPFKSMPARAIAKFIFKKCFYISIRGNVSLENIVNLGIDRKKIELVSDSAFLLKPSPQKLDYRERGKKLIGVAISKLVSSFGFSRGPKDSYRDFVDFMARLLDWTVEEFNAKIIMIPHAIQPERDDYRASLDVLKKMKQRKDAKILSKKFGAAEFKKAISYCDLVISARLHAAIAALSSSVPAIGISYSHKMKPIFGQLGVPNLVIDIKDLDWKITKEIEKILGNPDPIRRRLKKRIPAAQRRARRPALKIADFLTIISKGENTELRE